MLGHQAKARSVVRGKYVPSFRDKDIKPAGLLLSYCGIPNGSQGRLQGSSCLLTSLLSHARGTWRGAVVGRKMHPHHKNVHVLIPRTHKYVNCTAKGILQM